MRTKVAKYAQDLVTSLNGGKTLEDIAKDLNVEVLTSDPAKARWDDRVRAAGCRGASLYPA